MNIKFDELMREINNFIQKWLFNFTLSASNFLKVPFFPTFKERHVTTDSSVKQIRFNVQNILLMF